MCRRFKARYIENMESHQAADLPHIDHDDPTLPIQSSGGEADFSPPPHHTCDDLAGEQVAMDEFYNTYNPDPIRPEGIVDPNIATGSHVPPPLRSRRAKVVEQQWEEIKRNGEKPLYPGATLSVLCFMMQLLDFQAQYGGSNILFDHIFHWLSEIVLPKNNVAPSSRTEARKLLHTIGMDYNIVHACKHDCVLFNEENTLFVKCPNPSCGASRYRTDVQGEKVPVKVRTSFAYIVLNHNSVMVMKLCA